MADHDNGGDDIKHHHHNKFVTHHVDHDHPQSDHRDDGTHSNHAFGAADDFYFAAAHYDHDHTDDDEEE